jgi:hypothetical protein
MKRIKGGSVKKYQIIGADASTGQDRMLIVDAESEAAALAQARGQGVFASRVVLLAEVADSPTTAGGVGPGSPPHPLAYASPQQPDRETMPPYSPPSPVAPSRSSVLGGLTFVAGIIGGIAVGDGGLSKEALGWIVFGVGCVATIQIYALGQIIELLTECVQRLRDAAKAPPKGRP